MGTVSFLPQQGFAATTNNWMGQLPNNMSIGDISIPGTHDSGSKNCTNLPGASCQDYTIEEQLNMGVRFLDIRCRYHDDELLVHHGSSYAGFGLGTVLTTINNFLQNNPTETVIMSLKPENATEFPIAGQDWTSEPGFEVRFSRFVDSYPDLFYKGNDLPKLGAVREKIVLVRRFGDTNNKPADDVKWQYDCTNWSDNDTTKDDNNKHYIQDIYNLHATSWFGIGTFASEAANQKIAKIKECFGEAINEYYTRKNNGFPSSYDWLHMNFTSCYKNSGTGASDLLNDDGINDYLKDFF